MNHTSFNTMTFVAVPGQFIQDLSDQIERPAIILFTFPCVCLPRKKGKHTQIQMDGSFFKEIKEKRLLAQSCNIIIIYEHFLRILFHLLLGDLGGLTLIWQLTHICYNLCEVTSIISLFFKIIYSVGVST